jgi:mRNA-degrading endonuclease RelE of RelBE toxin-antitoxin system
MSSTIPFTPVLQITFNEISAREMSALPQDLQLQLLDEFQITEETLEAIARGSDERFGKIEREGKKLLRYRASDYRIYFEIAGGAVIVHRMLHKNSFRDFLYRSNMPVAEDDQLGQTHEFWEMIEEGKRARKK